MENKDYWAQKFCPHVVTTQHRPFLNTSLTHPCEEMSRAVEMFGKPSDVAMGPYWGAKMVKEPFDRRWVVGVKTFYFRDPADAMLFKLTFG